MTIRTRLGLWYAVLLLAAFALIAGWTYYEIGVEHPLVRQALRTQGDSPLEEIGEILLFGGLPAFALALGGGWFLMRRALSPMTSLTRAVEDVHAGNLHEQIPRSGNGDEIDRLTEVFNDMTRRLNDSFQRVREFTLHASHELKTPLTVIRHELDARLHDRTLSAAERERFASLLEEIERLTQIVDGLNFITKSDAGLLKLEKSAVQLDDLLRDAHDDAQVLAQPQQIELCLEQCDRVTVLADRRRLRQLLLVLTDNAVKYNWPGGRINLALRHENGMAVLTVANTGAGIPTDLIGRVFDRFFRSDASHNREVEGCGLGLTIAQGIVRAHGGEIHMASEPRGLTTVTALLPALAAPVREAEIEQFASAN
jgi:signal transduction histidine kinase